MPVNLPTELLRSFAAVVDSGSMMRATERVFLTQSALSLQIKRLEETVQTALFHREGRRLTLTPEGQYLLSFARDILALNDQAVSALNGDTLTGPARIGLVQDFADTLLTNVLARFANLNPGTQLQVRVGGSQELLELLESDRLDVVLCMGAGDDPKAIRTTSMLWLGDTTLTECDLLPLAVLEKPCRFRDAALTALDAAGRPYRIALETPSLSALRAAVASNLGITCRTDMFLGTEFDPIPTGILPSLPQVTYLLQQRPSSHPTITRLAEFVETSVREF